MVDPALERSQPPRAAVDLQESHPCLVCGTLVPDCEFDMDDDDSYQSPIPLFDDEDNAYPVHLCQEHAPFDVVLENGILSGKMMDDDLNSYDVAWEVTEDD